MMFHDNVKQFKIKEFNMIGNFENGSIIGLSDAGLKLIYKLRTGNMQLDLSNLSEEELLLYNALQSQGYFNSTDKDNLKAAYLHVTNDCNLHCLGCYSQDSTRNNSQVLSFEEICTVIEKLSDMGVESLVISGGEPFLRDDIYDIFSYIKDELNIKGLQVITNGTRSNSYNPELLTKYVNELNISIDGYSEENPTFIRDKGIFNLVMENAKHLHENGVNIKLLATLHRKNIEDVGEYMTLAQGLGVPLSFSMLTVAGDFDGFDSWIPTEEQLSAYGKGGLKGLEQAYAKAKGTDFLISSKKSCGVGKSIISVGSDGTIYPCHMLHQKDISLGNILDNNIMELKEKCDNFAKTVDVDNLLSCRDCEYKYICGGGCRSHAYSQNSEIASEDSYCSMNKNYFDKVFEHLSKEVNT